MEADTAQPTPASPGPIQRVAVILLATFAMAAAAGIGHVVGHSRIWHEVSHLPPLIIDTASSFAPAAVGVAALAVVYDLLGARFKRNARRSWSIIKQKMRKVKATVVYERVQAVIGYAVALAIFALLFGLTQLQIRPLQLILIVTICLVIVIYAGVVLSFCRVTGFNPWLAVLFTGIFGFAAGYFINPV